MKYLGCSKKLMRHKKFRLDFEFLRNFDSGIHEIQNFEDFLNFYSLCKLAFVCYN